MGLVETPNERTLVIVRHAKSDRDVPGPDHDRPLNARGRREAPLLGEWLVRHVGPPDLVLCSSALRAQQTWELASSAYDVPPPVEIDDRIYDDGVQGVLSVLAGVSSGVRTLVTVGHEPTGSVLVHRLAGSGSAPDALREMEDGFRTACAAVLRTPASWNELGSGAGAARLELFGGARG